MFLWQSPRPKMYQLLFFLCLLFSVILAREGDIRFENLTTADGLSQHTIFAILQDHEGYLWFGTRDGLNKYDGHEFTIYQRDIYDSTSLSDNWVSALLEDRSGNLWIGTMNGGLNKYDRETGSFIRYQNTAAATRDSIPFNPLLYIKQLMQDSHGMIWILTHGTGLTAVDPNNDKFSYYPHVEYGNPGGISGFDINAIMEDSHGQIWIATAAGGLNRFNRQEGHFSHFRHHSGNLHSLSSNRINSLYEDNIGRLWIATDGGGLNYFAASENRFYTFKLPNPGNKHEGLGTVNRILQHPGSDQDHLWVSSGIRGLHLFQPGNGRFKTVIKDVSTAADLTAETTQLHIDLHGGLWMIDRMSRLHHLNTEETIPAAFAGAVSPNLVTTFHNDPLNPRSIGADHALIIYEDRSGILWFGSGTNGLSIHDRAKYKFAHYTLPNSRSKKRAPGVRTILKNRREAFDSFWLGTPGEGLFTFQRTTGRFSQYLHQPGNKHGLPSNDITTLLEDARGNLWVGTWNGLARARQDAAEMMRFTIFQNDSKDPTSLSDNRILSLHQDSDGDIWIGTMNGLNRFLTATQTFERHLEQRYYAPGTPANTIAAIHEDHKGRLWIGTTGGLVMLNRHAPPAESYVDLHYIRHDPDSPQTSLSNNWVYTIYEAQPASDDIQNASQILWLGTAGGGLNKMILPSDYDGTNPQNIEFIHFTDRDGLAGNSITGILPDDYGNLWLSSKQGLSRFTPCASGKPEIKNYDIDDGLQGDVFFLGSFDKSQTGEMFFGGENGFNSFHPDSIREVPDILKIDLTEVQILGQPLANDSISAGKLSLEYTENFFSFKFAAISFSNAAKIQYKFKLDGFDNSWVENGPGRFANYTNVPPGAYTFRVQASNGDGIWSGHQLTIPVLIRPPFWQTWWFRILMTFCAGGLLLTIHRWRIQSLEKQKSTLNNLVQARTSQLESQNSTIQEQADRLLEMDRLKRRLFANISHEFRTPLMLIKGPLEDLIEKNPDPDKANLYGIMQRNTARLLRLVHQLLDLTRIESGELSLSISEGNLVALAKDVILSFSPLAERRRIHLSFQCNLHELSGKFDGDKVEKILYNLVGNAVKFTPEGGRVTLALEFQESRNGKLNRQKPPPQMIKITIRDSGIGIPEEKLPRIFDRFYQVNGATESHRQDYEGMGIGLALTADLVKLHGGRLNVSSKPGAGSTFTVILPIQEVSSVAFKSSNGFANLAMLVNCKEHIPQRICATQKTAADDRPLILLIEDNEDVQTYLASHLQEHFRVRKAGDGRQGLALAEELVPDLIISDIMMPLQDGYDVCSRLKNIEATSHIPIILLTARASINSKMIGLEIGADDYLTKPFKIAELKARIRNLINQRRQLRRKYRQQMVLQPADIEITSMDQAFLQKVCQIIEASLDKPGFGAAELRERLRMSKAQYHRKIHALTDQSPSQLIRTMRLQRAKQMLEKQAGNIAEIAFAVGFNNLSYFSKCFREQFGKLPSQLENKC